MLLPIAFEHSAFDIVLFEHSAFDLVLLSIVLCKLSLPSAFEHLVESRDAGS